MLRCIPHSMDPRSVELIDTRLQNIAAQEGVTIPLAIESGSRAWGFPSPDSDYDCRFIFVRTTNDYLSLFPQRDVIETPLEYNLDINGWDIVKALRLLLKGNAVVIEWLTSPITYQADKWFREELLALARRVVARENVAKHYLHLGERQRHAYFSDGQQVKLKKIFYALRPAAALRWLRLHRTDAVAPMHFQTLMEECDAPIAVRETVYNLIRKKAVTHELGSDLLPLPLANFIDSEFSIARDCFAELSRPIAERAMRETNAFFRDVLERFGNTAKNSLA